MSDETKQGDSAICGGCDGDISYGPQGWTHEDSDQRGCERAVPSPAERVIEVAPGEYERCEPSCPFETMEWGCAEDAPLELPAVPAQVAGPTCPMCEFEQKPCPGGAHAFALWEDGIRTVEDYAKMRAAQPVSAPSPEIPRYSISWTGEEIFEDENGQHVRYEDHASILLAAQQERHTWNGLTAQQWEADSDNAHRLLRTAREERDQHKADWLKAIDHGLAQHIAVVREKTQLIQELATEREARKQEADKAFNAGWNEAIDAAAKYCNEDYRVNPSEMRLRLSKPVSGSPERLEGGK